MNKKRILVVDDEEKLVEVIVSVIRSEMPEVEYDVAYNGKEALEKCQQLKTPYDLMITDLNMPKMEGNDLIRALGKIPEINPKHIIVISGYINLGGQTKTIENILFIEKPFRMNDLMKHIREELK